MKSIEFDTPTRHTQHLNRGHGVFASSLVHDNDLVARLLPYPPFTKSSNHHTPASSLHVGEKRSSFKSTLCPISLVERAYHRFSQGGEPESTANNIERLSRRATLDAGTLRHKNRLGVTPGHRQPQRSLSKQNVNKHKHNPRSSSLEPHRALALDIERGSVSVDRSVFYEPSSSQSDACTLSRDCVP